MKEKITSYTLYRWRYILGYVIGGLLILSIMVFNLLFVPGGLRTAEETSAVASGALSFAQFDPSTVINLPYHVLQRASFALFDVSALTVKLPSIVLGVLAVIGCYLLLASWFRRNTAVITTIIAATMPAMLFIMQDGTPTVYAIAVSFWLLYTATCVSRAVHPRMLWNVLFFILMALNLYAPLGIWLNLAILSTILFHPHIRYGARRFNVNHFAIAGAVGFVILAPLIYSLTTKPEIGLTLLGIPQGGMDLMANLSTLSAYYFIGSPNLVVPYLEPLFPIATMLLVMIGFYRFILIKHTARSYVTWLWGIILIPMIVLNPDAFMMILPLAVLMIAVGIASLIHEWYVLFPRNPYARVIGLIPLGIIVAGIGIINTYHYIAGYHYAPKVVAAYTHDVRVLNQTLARTTASEAQKITVLVPKSSQDFYRLIARYDKRFEVRDESSLPTDGIYILHGQLRSSLTPSTAPEYIAVDSSTEQADRFYLYTEEAK